MKLLYWVLFLSFFQSLNLFAQELSEAQLSPSTRPWGVRLEPMNLFFGVYGGDIHYSFAPSWDVGVSANWFHSNHSATGASATNVWQLGPSAIYYPGHTHDDDGVYLHGCLNYLPVTITTRDTATDYTNWITSILVGYGWVNRWHMTIDLGLGLTYYHEDQNYKNTTLGTLGDNNTHCGVQPSGEFSVGWLF